MLTASMLLRQAAEKPSCHGEYSMASAQMGQRKRSRRMLKKARLLTLPTLARRDAPSPQQGRRRSKNRRRYRPHLVGPFARSMDLGERKNTSSTSALRKYQRYVEDSCEMRTKLAGLFSILPARSAPGAQAATDKRLAQGCCGRKAERSGWGRGNQFSRETCLFPRWRRSR